MALQKSCERVGGRVEESRGDRISTKKPIESTNLDLLGVPESEPPAKSHTLGGLRHTQNFLILDKTIISARGVVLSTLK